MQTRQDRLVSESNQERKMPKYALFIGCNIPARVEQYEASARAVLKQVGIEVKEIPDFNCCGYPMRNTNQKAYLFSAAVNLALAESLGLEILTLCKCCFGSLKKAVHTLARNGDVQNEIRQLLEQRNLEYNGRVKINHFLTVLYHEIGLSTLKTHIQDRYRNIKIATHYGCHALRPSKITEFDDPVAPRIFDRLVEITGAHSVDWSRKTECCGAPVLGINDDVSRALARKKISNGLKSRADYLCSACPFCHMQFDTVQAEMVSDNGDTPLASILYPQLLGLSMGIAPHALGLEKNRLDISNIATFLNQEQTNVQ